MQLFTRDTILVYMSWWMLKNVFTRMYMHLITYTKMIIVYDKSYRVDDPLLFWSLGADYMINTVNRVVDD